MSYTAPQYVDTKEQAILALASTIKGEAVTGGDGSVNRALDILADVLAEQDVQVPQTDAGAILALAQYASGMVKPTGTIAITENGEGIDVAQYATADVSVSGGGGSVGALVDVPRVKSEQVDIGDNISNYANQIDASRVKLGSDTVVEGEGAITRIALGSTFEYDCPTFVGTTASAKMYDAAFTVNVREEPIIDSISEISGATKLETLEIGGDEIQRLTVYMPAAAPADSHAYVLEIIPAE